MLIARDEDDAVLVAGCPAWCREHVGDEHMVTALSGPALACTSICQGEEEPGVTVGILPDAVMSVGEVEDLARTLLSLAVAARRNAPVE